MKLQYISDIHLEYHSNNISPFENIVAKIDCCENICLLGDIGFPDTELYNEFIHYCSKTWKNIFLIYGNHEYYQISNKAPMTMNQINDLTRKLPPNVYFLNNSCLYIDKSTNEVFKNINTQQKENYIKIVGTTLWTDIDLKISNLINDYRFIYTLPGVKLTPVDTKEFFKTSKDYILKELSEKIEVILLTHHGVHELTNGYYRGNITQSGYSTNITELLNFDNLVACINGHTHSSINTVMPDTKIKLLSNCYGYKEESQKIVRYNKSAILEIN